jgi:hypothetical protein
MNTTTKPMTEAQFTYAMNLTMKVYADPAQRAEKLLALAGHSFYSISPIIDELKAKIAAMFLAAPKPAAAPTGYTPPKAYYLVDGTVYQLKPSKAKTKMYVFVDGAYFGTWGFGKALQLAEALGTPELAMAATIAYATKTTRCGVCNIILKDPKSVAAGIGPVCAKNYGK